MNSSDQQPRFCAAAKWIFRAGAVTLLLGLPAGERAAFAQDTPPAKPPAPPAATAAPAAPDTQGLREAITQKYEVLAVSNGVVLKPRTEELGVRTIEVSGDTIAVNGERVSEGVLRAWLSEQAEPIVRLHRLRPAERKTLFDLKTGTGEMEVPDTGTAESAAPADGDTAEEPEEGEETEIPDVGEIPAPPEAPAAPEVPEPPSVSSGSVVKIIGKITVDKDEIVEEAVAVLGSVRVDGEVAQDVVAVGGSVTINGKVGGNVVSVGRDVRLGPHSEVMGDVTSVGGTILRAEGSKVHGSTQDVGVGGGNRDWHRDVDIDTGFPFFGLLWSLIWLIVLALMIFLCLMLGRPRVDRAEACIASEPWKAAAVGLLAVFLFLPLLLVVTVLLVITLVGCAVILLYPFFAIVLALLLLVGYTASAHRLGTLLEQRFDRRFGSPYATALMGLLALDAWIILGNLLGLVGLHVIGALLVVFGIAAHFAALVVGLGGVILDRLNGPAAGVVPPAPLGPPIPPAPPGPGTPGYTAPSALPLSEQWEEEERRWEEESEDRRVDEEPPPPEG